MKRKKNEAFAREPIIYASVEEWHAEGVKRFGPDMMKWKFVCPACGHVQTPEDYKAAGAPESTVGFSCVGRWLKKCRDAFEGKGEGPCNYAGGGLFRIGPVQIKSRGDERTGDFPRYFAFAEATDHENCEKIQHDPDVGYLHDRDDDTPYDVDGVMYCGRCHRFIP